ncbi:endonuclease domain-containing 1 protein-like [Salvelinus fontinalis]|uniref:endonuclease domain-containing 1 protein-like n=1 Tax=Salvelinus fontinalis TaxID=8038 RepID=UPI002486174A|nr:endonuclease domain-containing 1 protein-like [Salvelinus fontinalis]
MIEPQLEDINNQRDMKVDNKAVTHQAVDTDYKLNKMKMDRGHLFPCSYAPDDDTKRSTFTLTNAVPQASSFNKGSWKTMECRVRKALMKDCINNNGIKAYVVTGAVPSNNNNNNNNKLNDRVNIPSHLWTTYCCKNNLGQLVAGAHWAENVAEEKNEMKTVTPITLNQLELKLKSVYELSEVKLFPKGCSTNVEQAGGKRTGEPIGELTNKKQKSGEGSIKMKRAGELKECDEEDECDCDCDEK